MKLKNTLIYFHGLQKTEKYHEVTRQYRAALTHHQVENQHQNTANNITVHSSV